MDVAQPIKSLIYVSRKILARPQGATDIEDILSVAASRNKALSVTGALMSASDTFAQYIEGPQASIDQLMVSINRDARHRDVKVLSVKHGSQRMFEGWTLAYSGDEHYIVRHINRLLNPLTPGILAERARDLESLMLEFSKKLSAG